MDSIPTDIDAAISTQKRPVRIASRLVADGPVVGRPPRCVTSSGSMPSGCSPTSAGRSTMPCRAIGITTRSTAAAAASQAIRQSKPSMTTLSPTGTSAMRIPVPVAKTPRAVPRQRSNQWVTATVLTSDSDPWPNSRIATNPMVSVTNPWTPAIHTSPTAKANPIAVIAVRTPWRSMRWPTAGNPSAAVIVPMR